MQTIKGLLLLLRDTVAAFLQDRATLYAAGLAYYTVFSLAPLLVFVVTVAGFFIGRSEASDQIAIQLQLIVGAELGGFLQELLGVLNDQSSAGTVTVVSLVGLLFGATGIFNQIKNSVNILWGLVPRRLRGVRGYLQVARSRAIPFLMVFLFGFMLSAAVLVDTVLGVAQSRIAVFFPELAAVLPSLSRIVVPLLTLVTFALIYKLLPDARVRWRDVWPGALLATLLFQLGRYLLTLYLERSNTGSAFGAAGSLVVLLVWVYFSANMLLLGAEFIKLYATRFGLPIRPGATARFEGDPIAEEGAPGPSGLSLDERVL